MTKHRLSIITYLMPDASEEEQDAAQERLCAFLRAALALHAEAHARDNRQKFDSVDEV